MTPVQNRNTAVGDVYAHQVIDRFSAARIVPFPHREQGATIPGEIGETRGGVALGDLSRPVFLIGSRRHLVHVLVGEVQEIGVIFG